MEDFLLDIPPRFMWGWGPNVSGYCGSMTIQSIAIYYGSYVSQDRVRGLSGGHDGKHEVMLGRGGCCAAIDMMSKLSLNASQWSYWSASRPQSKAFLSWMRQAVKQQEPVAFGVFMQTETNEGFDHIVPLVGFERDGGTLVFNDLHSRVALRKQLPGFVATRAACRRALPWSERFAYCLPSDVNYGIRVHGNSDSEGALYPARLIMDEWTEPDYSAEDSKGESPKLLGATLHTRGLTPGRKYSVLVFDDWTRVPKRAFSSNQTGGLVSRVDFVATRADGTHQRRVSFMSDSTTFYRVVDHASRSV